MGSIRTALPIMSEPHGLALPEHGPHAIFQCEHWLRLASRATPMQFPAALVTSAPRLPVGSQTFVWPSRQMYSTIADLMKPGPRWGVVQNHRKKLRQRRPQRYLARYSCLPYVPAVMGP